MTTNPFADLVETPEHDLVRAIFADQILLQGIGVPPQMGGPLDFRLRVTPSDVGLPLEAFGDADAVLVQEQQYELARAVEFKRVKISARGLRSGTVSKLPALTKAVHQANALQAAGFAFVWITVVVVADMRPVTGGTGYAAPPLALIEQVRSYLPLREITPEIGVSICEITQVSDRPANERGGAGSHMLRNAVHCAQPAQLTRGLAALFARVAAT